MSDEKSDLILLGKRDFSLQIEQYSLHFQKLSSEIRLHSVT